MSVVLKVDIQGLEGVMGTLNRIRGRAKDLKPAFKAAGVLVLESVNRNFIEGGRPDKWKPLSEATRELRGDDAQVLRDKGLLMTSIGRPSGQGIYELKPLTLRIGTNVPYAAYHDQPDRTDTGSVQAGLPQRKFMMLQPEDEEKIIKIFRDRVLGGA